MLTNLKSNDLNYFYEKLIEYTGISEIGLWGINSATTSIGSLQNSCLASDMDISQKYDNY